jgi:histidine ammonia-lyase
METTLLAVCLDALRIALAKAVEASGERLHKLQWPAFSDLPTGLADEGGATGGVQFLSLGHLGAAQVAEAQVAAMPVTPHYRGQICDGVEDIGGLAPFAVAQCERLIDAAWNVAAVEAVVGVWAITRRGLAADHLGAKLREPFAQIRALLPIGCEGEQPFDIEPIIRILQAIEAAQWP